MLDKGYFFSKELLLAPIWAPCKWHHSCLDQLCSYHIRIWANPIFWPIFSFVFPFHNQFRVVLGTMGIHPKIRKMWSSRKGTIPSNVIGLITFVELNGSTLTTCYPSFSITSSSSFSTSRLLSLHIIKTPEIHNNPLYLLMPRIYIYYCCGLKRNKICNT